MRFYEKNNTFVDFPLTISFLSKQQNSSKTEKSETVKKEKFHKDSITKKELENMSNKELETFLEKRLLLEIKDEFHDPYNTVIVEYGDKFVENNKVNFLAHINITGFKFKDGVFEHGTGSSGPKEFVYEKNPNNEKYKFKEIIEPLDGELFPESLKKMTRNNDELYKKVSHTSKSNEEIYHIEMDKLNTLAEKSNLKNYRHSLKSIPGYEKDVRYLESGTDYFKDSVNLMKNAEFKRMNTDADSLNLYDAIRYDKRTGIALRDKLFKKVPPSSFFDKP